MYTTTENNNRVMHYKMFQMGCLAFIVLILCQTVPGTFENLYLALMSYRAGESVSGYLIVAGMYGVLMIPALQVISMYGGLQRQIDLMRYGHPPLGESPDGCLGVSTGEILDGEKEL